MNQKMGLILMNVLYYLALFVLVMMLILPHTKIYYSFNLFDSFDRRANTKTVYLQAGKSYQISLFRIKKTASYKSSDFKVATVSGTGLVTAFRPGKTIVTIKQKNKTYKYQFYVIKLNKKKLRMRAGRLRKLSVKGVHFGVHWKSADRRIATVNRFGWVKGKKKGTTCVIATVAKHKLRCKVYVRG